MEKNPKQRTYSYFVTRSPKDKEFVATFLELEGLSGLGPTVHDAIRELDEALEAWIVAARDDELPNVAFPFPMVIIDRSFLGDEPLLQQLSAVLPEKLQPDENPSPAETTSGDMARAVTKTIRVPKDKQVYQVG